MCNECNQTLRSLFDMPIIGSDLCGWLVKAKITLTEIKQNTDNDMIVLFFLDKSIGRHVACVGAFMFRIYPEFARVNIAFISYNIDRQYSVKILPRTDSNVSVFQVITQDKVITRNMDKFGNLSK